MSCKMVAHASNQELFVKTMLGMMMSESSTDWSVLV